MFSDWDASEHFAICSHFLVFFVQVKSLTKLKPEVTLALHIFSRHNWACIFHATSDRFGIANCVFLCIHVRSGIRSWARPAQSSLIGAVRARRIVISTPSASRVCLDENLVLFGSWLDLSLFIFFLHTHAHTHTHTHTDWYTMASVIWRRGTREMNYERLENERRLLLISTH